MLISAISCSPGPSGSLPLASRCSARPNFQVDTRTRPAPEYWRGTVDAVLSRLDALKVARRQFLQRSSSPGLIVAGDFRPHQASLSALHISDPLSLACLLAESRWRSRE